MRASAGAMTARFHGSSGPTAIASTSGATSGSTVWSKNGAPTESCTPNSRSANGGYSVPVNTTAAMAHRKMLFTTSALSRLSTAKNPLAASTGARTANNSSEPPIVSPSSARMNSPWSGAAAKLCTEFRIPERTRNVPDRLSENVAIASSTVQAFSASRFSTTMAQCSSAVPVSHGSSAAFSTGSQNQYPPQPNV